MPKPVFAFTLELPRAANRILVDSGVGVPKYLHNPDADKNQKIKIPAKALVDTGATRSCISRRLALASKAVAFSKTKMSTAGGVVLVNVYQVDLFLPNGMFKQDVRVSEFFDNGEFDIIIGMDIICDADMALTNAAGKTVFSMRYPPDYRHIDYESANKPDKHGKLAKDYIKKNQTGKHL